MKKYVSVLVFITIIASLSICNKNNFKKDKTIHKDINKIAVISDLHLRSDETYQNLYYYYNDVIIDAILDDIENNDVDLLILAGDNTNDGRNNQHLKLIKKLDKYKDQFEILITVGNHDLGTLKQKEYADIYKNYGYNSYSIKDKNSLSYAVTFNNLTLIVLDTGGYIGYDANPSVKRKTVNWLAKQFKSVKDQQKEILCIGHHPLLASDPKSFKERDEIKDLMFKYDIPLYICGHLHNHDVLTEKGLYELVVKQTSVYPVNYQIINLYSSSISVTTNTVDIENYAKNHNLNDDYLSNFNQISEEQLKTRSYETVDLLVKNKFINNNDLKEAKDFFYCFNKHFCFSDLSEHIEELNNHPGKQIFINLAKNSNYYPWIINVLNSSNRNKNTFIINN